MRSSSIVLGLGFAGLLVAPAFGVTNGRPDGNDHPSVAGIYATQGIGPCDGIIAGCTGVLISPTVVVTSRFCADFFKDPTEYGYTSQGIWVDFDPNQPFNRSGTCATPSHVDPNNIFLNPVFDPNATNPIGNMGVLILDAPAPSTPAALPTAGLVDSLLASQPYTVAATGGELSGVQGVSFSTIIRRAADGKFVAAGPEILRLSLERALSGARLPCTDGATDEAGGAFLGTSNMVVALVIAPEASACPHVADYQRLDVPSARNFLGNFVTLP